MCNKIQNYDRWDSKGDTDHKSGFYVDASFITKKSFMRLIKDYPREEYNPAWPQKNQTLYPKPSIYYAFSEDSNPFDRVDLVNELNNEDTHEPLYFKPSEESYSHRDPYSESEARVKYLQTKPTCFAIFSKPGLNTIELATKIAHTWNCILVSPIPLVHREIKLGTERGQAIERILRSGECLMPDIIMDLIRSRIQTREVQHKGYVLEGLPLIPNEELDYSSYLSTTVCNDSASCKKKTKKPRIVKYQSTKEISKQINDIFKKIILKPSVIIYVFSADEEFIEKRSHFRLDPTSGKIIDTSPRNKIEDIMEKLPSRNRKKSDLGMPLNLYEELINQEEMLDNEPQKYLLRRICDMQSNVEAQCDLYKKIALPVIDKWILSYNPENVIRVNSHASVLRMHQIIYTRLHLLPIYPVIVPKKIQYFVKTDLETEATDDEFEREDPETIYKELMYEDTVAPQFPWRLSSWQYLCPVELAKGRTVNGLSEYTVQFMNKIYFLSSLKAMDLFVENPRPFLMTSYPRPTCKIVVFGPDYSGKSHLCQELSRIFGGTVINVKERVSAMLDDQVKYICDELIELTIEEKAKVIVDSINSIPKKRIDDTLYRGPDYIVDGMYPNFEIWQKVVEDLHVTFEDVVVLLDDPPYNYLIDKWYQIQESNSNIENTESIVEDMNPAFGENPSNLSDYIDHIEKFMSEWKVLSNEISKAAKTLIVCNLKNTKNITEYVVNHIQDRYIEKPKILSSDDWEDEYTVGMLEEVEDKQKKEEEESGKDDSPVGELNGYCPVVLIKHNILWKGKREFSAFFMDKIYLLSSINALNEFVANPGEFSIPFSKPINRIPPLRVSVVGPPGSGNNTFSNMMSREYGLAHVDYHFCFTGYLKDRGMTSFTRKDILISSEDFIDDFNLPEALNDEMYNSDFTTIQSFIRHYWKNGAILPERMLNECVLDFFRSTFKNQPIVFQGFPSCLQDIEIAIENYAIPEIIIELRCSLDECIERKLPELLSLWKERQEAQKRLEQERYHKEMEDYKRRQDEWLQKTLNEMWEQKRKELQDQNEEYEMNDYKEKYESDLFDMEYFYVVESEKFGLKELWEHENPEPVLFTDWEDPEIAKDRIKRNLEDMYETESSKLEIMRSSIKETTIPWIEINTSSKNTTEVFLELITILSPRIFRNISYFEKTYTIDSELVENLLNCGYFFLSSFGRTCPVQIYEKKNPYHMFLLWEAKREIYPVAHRRCIYFLGGKNALLAFQKNPLKYLEQDSCFPLVPLRLSIIGPPKCGKTTLARRFAEQYGMKLITRGSALRNILKNFSWTKIAQNVEFYLRSGRIVPDQYMMRAVEMYCIDPLVLTQGLIFDGFPSNREEVQQLTFLGLSPMIVLDLNANLTTCLEYLAYTNNEIRRSPIFPQEFLLQRYASWKINASNFRSWLMKFNQNVIELDASRSKWHIWHCTDQIVRTRFSLIKQYFSECDCDKVHKLEFMSVTPYEFRKRQSEYEAFCPLCLFHDDCLVTSGPPPDSHGMVQFREYFYWICAKHLSDFYQDPMNHLPPANTSELPSHRPRIVNQAVDLQNTCWSRHLQIEGYCIVTYVDNLPQRRLQSGKSNLAVLYKDKLYLFCSSECREKFVVHYSKYIDVSIKFYGALPPVTLKNFPDIGFLEQTVADILIKAVNKVSVLRPKIPGLSPSATAAVYIGVYLKLYNTNCELKEMDIYEGVNERLKSYARHVKIHDPRFDYLCKHFNPASAVPGHLNVVDIAGLVKGASTGQGLGNSFLSHISACDAMFHLCRAFDDTEIQHVEGDVDPVRDLEIISDELILKDLEFLQNNKSTVQKLALRGKDKKLTDALATFTKIEELLNNKKWIRHSDWNATEIEVLNKYLFLTAKPVVYLINLSEKDYIRKKNKWLVKIKEWVDKNDPGAIIIPFSAAFEYTLVDMDSAERDKYLEEVKVASCLDKIIVQGLKALQLQYFFTAGADEVKAWMIQKGTKAPQAAGKIHTDFEKGFIMAEVMKYDDFVAEGSEAAVRAAGKYRQQGRNYVVDDGDIIFFKFNAGAGLKDPKKK